MHVNEVSLGNQRISELYIGQNNVIHVVWLDARVGGKYDYYYSYSTEGGLIFSENERIPDKGFDDTFTRPGDYFYRR
ncbi:MAG: hypothetical protein JW776_12675 [Candidatus Lokiarchaeota archaeon]|nr:hypothetical protein [Candidatus Lokiarchaeota archaeon]